jgi:hypothetical protein
MNVVLWVLQAVLALLSFAGGAFKAFRYDELSKVPSSAALSRGVWTAVGVFEMVCGILLVVPWATGWRPILTPLAAAALVIESLGLAVVYARYSRALSASNPLVYVVVMAAMAAVVAWGRSTMQ